MLFLRPLLTWQHKPRNVDIRKKLNQHNTLEIRNYRQNWLQHVNSMENNCLTKISNVVSAPWKRDIVRPRRRWREQDHVKVNELRSTGLQHPWNECLLQVYTIGAGFGHVTSSLILWLMQPRDSRDHFIVLLHVRFVVPRTSVRSGFWPFVFFLKLLHVLMALNNKKYFTAFYNYNILSLPEPQMHEFCNWSSEGLGKLGPEILNNLN